MNLIRGPSAIATQSIDIRDELSAFTWTRPTWTHDRLTAASPFRHDNTPSFYVILDGPDAGSWGDSGGYDPEYQRGGLVKLLSFLRDESRGETLDYLRAKYGSTSDPPDENDEIELRLPRYETEPTARVARIDSAILDRYKFRSPYLADRAISEAAQRLMNVGYDKERRAITLPWFNADGSLGNVKYRRTDAKTFWYAKSGRPIREMVYAINVVYGQKLRKCAVVEAEIDALTLMTAGIPAIATGGTAFTDAKRDLILRSPLEEIVLLRDNDEAGRAWRNRVITGLAGKIEIRVGCVRSPFKDVNEWAVAEESEKLRRMYERSRLIRAFTARKLSD